jgi:hypothetical protein
MDSYNQAVASGLQMGLAAGAQRADRALRMQQLQSQAALQRMQEERLAKDLAMRMAEYDVSVQERADMAKAMARVDLQSQPELQVPAEGPAEMGGQAPTAFLPNPAHVPLDQSLLQNLLPVVAKYRPGEVDNFVSNIAMLPYRQAQAQRWNQAGPGEIHTVEGPDGQKLNVLVPPPGKGANKLVGTGAPNIVNQDGRAFSIDAAGVAKPLPPDVGKRMGAAASNALAKEAPHLSIPNPDAPGFRMIDPERWDEYERQSRITPADRSKLEQRIVKLQDTTRRLQNISEQAENIFGPKALAGTIVVDRVLATMNPSLAVGQRIQGREAARYTMEGLVRSLTQGQGALSNQDVNRIYAMFPELGRPAELANNPARSRAIISQLQKQLALDEITDAQVLGRKPSIEALTYVDPAYLIEELEKGRIQPEVFRRAFNDNVHKADVEALANQR